MISGGVEIIEDNEDASNMISMKEKQQGSFNRESEPQSPKMDGDSQFSEQDAENNEIQEQNENISPEYGSQSLSRGSRAQISSGGLSAASSKLTMASHRSIHQYEDFTDNANVGTEGNLQYESISTNQEKAYQNELDRRKTEKLVDLKDPSKAQMSYLKNSPEEEQILDYSENFRQQYTRLFPSRKELLLSPVNEFGVKKFICTTIKPTRLHFKELYDYRTCAEFVSNYIVYEPLEPCYELPQFIFSPSLTLSIQHGNCYDMAIFLTCLLRGAGYDAYVVSGYATKRMTMMDNTQALIDVDTLFETYHTEKSLMKLNFGHKENKKGDGSTNSKYKLKPVKRLVSNFLEKQAEKQANLEKEKIQEQNNREDMRRQLEQEEEEEDEFSGLRIYAWVMILPGRREVPEPFFIDPPTGKQFATEDINFLGVESVFSSRNYWVNMQPCYDGLKGISFDLNDSTKWEFVLNTGSIPTGSLHFDEEDEDKKTEDSKHKNSEAIELPPSWVSALIITQEQYESKCPVGYKTIVYRNAKHEIFSEYNRPDGMIARITTFIDSWSKIENEVHEFYSSRIDKLKKRIRKPHVKTIHELFDHGKQFDIKEHLIFNGKTVEVLFYDYARYDGLISRTYHPRKIVENYVDREDGLYYRSCTYSDDEMKEIKKMTEKFNRNPDEPASESIAKRTFFLQEEKIRVIFHRDKNTLFPSFREFKRPNMELKQANILNVMDSFQAERFNPPRKQQQLHLEMFGLITAEQSLLTEIKKMDREIKEILKLREQEENNIVLNVSLLDTIRNENVDVNMTETSKDYQKDDEATDHQQADFLTPFLINHLKSKYLSKDEAMAIKDACLKSLKDRLIERANIIQSRLDELNSEYQRRQLIYSKNSDTMTVQETEEHMKFCNETLFKIHILEKRLAKHKETAPDKYLEMDAKLKEDPRLHAINSRY